MSYPNGCMFSGQNKIKGQCDYNACNYPFCVSSSVPFEDSRKLNSELVDVVQHQSQQKGADEQIIRSLVAGDLFNKIHSPSFEWFPIKNESGEHAAPIDDSEFLVGMWVGEKLWNEDYTVFAWASKPVWKQAISHHENPYGPYQTRGWNHRNGALGGNATHWARLLPEPELTDPVAQI